MKAYKIGQIYALVEIIHERSKQTNIDVDDVLTNPSSLNDKIEYAINLASTEFEEYAEPIRDLLIEISFIPESFSDSEKEDFQKGYLDERIQLKTIRYEIGNVIANKRAELGITQHQLSAMTGISQSNIGRIEKGRYTIGIDVLEKIAMAINWNVFKI